MVKRILVVVVIIIAGCCLATCTSVSQSFKGSARTILSLDIKDIIVKKIAVLQFDEVAPEHGAHMAKIFSEESMNLERYTILERNQVDLRLKTLVDDGNIRGISRKISVSEIGQALGVEAIVLGKVEKEVSRVSHRASPQILRFTVTARLIHVETNTIIWSSTWVGQPFLAKTVSSRLWIEIAKEMVNDLKIKLDALERERKPMQ